MNDMDKLPENLTNRMCLRCKKLCKQSINTKIIKCPNFEENIARTKSTTTITSEK
jgi:hypothetical protein